MSKKRIILGICVLGLLGASFGCSAQAKLGTPEVKAATPPPPEPTPPPPPEPAPKPAEPAKPPEAVKPAGRVKLEGGKIVISEQIAFDQNKAVIKIESNGLIDEIAKTIKENDKIKKVSVEGHTSAEGDAGANMKLSNERAAAVMKALIERGIDKSKLTSKGFGVTKPLGDNSTPNGRMQNRRVEFLVTE
jgi:outer membrane protein OmpA-like peptidoglycan-associated protein